ncbi:MAG: DegT/DnrJ/EryC1/StrS family aminotransferase [Planctomycetota bacterium]|jgi:dTDP-4-amino-4,6-dideoxyglucose|nr:DegT/DnrJ/EryC1/StrS family aminotransferase [Planctomycetota bacterium]
MELAVFAGRPFFPVPQPVGGPIIEPELGREFHRLADAAFARNRLTNSGPLAARLEEEVAARHRCGEAVLVANATLAQMLLLRALGLTSGEALISANTFVATAQACEWLGLKPVFCDIDPETLNLSPGDCERKSGPETRAVIPTHVFGVMADLPALAELAGRRGFRLLADAAHAFDCDRGGIPPGGFGIPEFISFHATKFFSTVEGGAILTGDSALARELRELRNFGFDRPGDAGRLGLNAKLSELAAAFGLASLPLLERRARRLGETAEIYRRELAGIPGLEPHRLDRLGRNNHRYFPLFVDEAAFGLSRDFLRLALERENVLPRTYFHPGCHRMGLYRDRPGVPDLPVAERLLGRLLALPTSFAEVEARAAAKAVTDLIRTMHDRAGEVKRALAAA